MGTEFLKYTNRSALQDKSVDTSADSDHGFEEFEPDAQADNNPFSPKPTEIDATPAAYERVREILADLMRKYERYMNPELPECSLKSLFGDIEGVGTQTQIANAARRLFHP